jgi:hypothetical protein
VGNETVCPWYDSSHEAPSISAGDLPVIRHIAPQFFPLDIPGTLAYYEAKLGFTCLGTW